MKSIIIGIDEVGRGPWAGPLVAAAAALYPDTQINGLADSKKLTAPQREKLFRLICAKAPAIGVGWVSSQILDEVGLTEATHLAMAQALNQIRDYLEQDYEIIIDGNHDYLPDVSNTRVLIKADQTIPAVSAASIVAKVCRDRYMRNMHSQYPDYNFETHVGYGTARHREVLDLMGPCKLHRLSFSPLKNNSVR